VYFGSTLQTLRDRMKGHRFDYKRNEVLGKHKDIVKDIDGWYIELYENYPCNLNTELIRREGEVMREIDTLNKYIAGGTRGEYRIENADKIKQSNKISCRKNADKYAFKDKEYSIKNADKRKEYRLKNADKRKEDSKQYCLKNADKLKEDRKQYRLKMKLEKQALISIEV